MTKRLIILELICFSFFLLFTSCEDEFIPNDDIFEEEVVVEGFIEAGSEALPPYVILTRTFPFFNTLESDLLDSLFVRNSTVTIIEEDGTEVELTELCLSDLPEDIRAQVALVLGIEIDTSAGAPEVNICAFVDLAGEVEVEEGKRYDLEVRTPDEVITASTTIPVHVPLDSIWFSPNPGIVIDTLAEMNALISDPSGPDFYRFLTAENGGNLIAPFGSVTDDVFFDGQEFFFPISKAEDPNDPDIDFETFGLWRIGDTATLKWITIDEDHFNFWQTFEFNRNNQGPFSTYTRVEHNINGGIGIWGGLSSSIYTQEVRIE